MRLHTGQLVYDAGTGRHGRIMPTCGEGPISPVRACVWLNPSDEPEGYEWLADIEDLEPPNEEP